MAREPNICKRMHKVINDAGRSAIVIDSLERCAPGWNIDELLQDICYHAVLCERSIRMAYNEPARRDMVVKQFKLLNKYPRVIMMWLVQNHGYIFWTPGDYAAIVEATDGQKEEKV